MKYSMMSKGLFAATAIALAATSFSVGASAQPRITKSVEVNYNDLNLVSVNGQNALDGRIKVAVRKICGSYNSRSFKDVADHNKCVDEANFSAKRAKVSLIAKAEAGTLEDGAIMVGGN